MSEVQARLERRGVHPDSRAGGAFRRAVALMQRSGPGSPMWNEGALGAGTALLELAAAGARTELEGYLTPDPEAPASAWTVLCYEVGDLSPSAVRDFAAPDDALATFVRCDEATHVASELLCSTAGGLRWTALARTGDRVVFQPPTVDTSTPAPDDDSALDAALERWDRRARGWAASDADAPGATLAAAPGAGPPALATATGTPSLEPAGHGAGGTPADGLGRPGAFTAGPPALTTGPPVPALDLDQRLEVIDQRLHAVARTVTLLAERLSTLADRPDVASDVERRLRSIEHRLDRAVHDVVADARSRTGQVGREVAGLAEDLAVLRAEVGELPARAGELAAVSQRTELSGAMGELARQLDDRLRPLVEETATLARAVDGSTRLGADAVTGLHRALDEVVAGGAAVAAGIAAADAAGTARADAVLERLGLLEQHHGDLQRAAEERAASAARSLQAALSTDLTRLLSDVAAHRVALERGLARMEGSTAAAAQAAEARALRSDGEVQVVAELVRASTAAARQGVEALQARTDELIDAVDAVQDHSAEGFEGAARARAVEASAARARHHAQLQHQQELLVAVDRLGAALRSGAESQQVAVDDATVQLLRALATASDVVAERAEAASATAGEVAATRAEAASAVAAERAERAERAATTTATRAERAAAALGSQVEAATAAAAERAEAASAVAGEVAATRAEAASATAGDATAERMARLLAAGTDRVERVVGSLDDRLGELDESLRSTQADVRAAVDAARADDELASRAVTAVERIGAAVDEVRDLLQPGTRLDPRRVERALADLAGQVSRLADRDASDDDLVLDRVAHQLEGIEDDLAALASGSPGRAVAAAIDRTRRLRSMVADRRSAR